MRSLSIGKRKAKNRTKALEIIICVSMKLISEWDMDDNSPRLLTSSFSFTTKCQTFIYSYDIRIGFFIWNTFDIIFRKFSSASFAATCNQLIGQALALRSSGLWKRISWNINCHGCTERIKKIVRAQLHTNYAQNTDGRSVTINDRVTLHILQDCIIEIAVVQNGRK